MWLSLQTMTILPILEFNMFYISAHKTIDQGRSTESKHEWLTSEMETKSKHVISRFIMLFHMLSSCSLIWSTKFLKGKFKKILLKNWDKITNWVKLKGQIHLFIIYYVHALFLYFSFLLLSLQSPGVGVFFFFIFFFEKNVIFSIPFSQLLILNVEDDSTK